jgi:hypothetical protein
MSTDEHGLKHASITEQIIGIFFDVYNELGSGFLESVYVEALAHALLQAGLLVGREMPLVVVFRGKVVGSGGWPSLELWTQSSVPATSPGQRPEETLCPSGIAIAVSVNIREDPWQSSLAHVDGVS